MAILIEGVCVVALRERIDPLLESGAVEAPNATELADDHLWRCAFMVEADAVRFVESLEARGLNGSDGPTPDVVLVNQMGEPPRPECSWLEAGLLGKAMIAWRSGTEPQTIVAYPGWDPERKSAIAAKSPEEVENLQFLRRDGKMVSFLDPATGKECHIAMLDRAVDVEFQWAASIVGAHLRTAVDPPLSSQALEEVSRAIDSLDNVIEENTHHWEAVWFRGLATRAMGNQESALDWLLRASDLAPDEKPVLCDLFSSLVELGRLDEALATALQCETLNPRDSEVLGNLALIYLLVGEHRSALAKVSKALEIDPSNEINMVIRLVVSEVIDRRRPQPESLDDLRKPPPKKKPFWRFR